MKQYIIFIIALFSIVNTVIGQESEPDYLCFEVEAGTKISFGEPSKLQYSYDKQTWQTLTNSGVTVTNDCFVYFRGNNPNGLNKGVGEYKSFSISKPAKCSGNIMTLIDKTGQTLEIPNQHCFYRLFHNCPITTAPKLPALILKSRCYYSMFEGCSNLILPPELPATTLAESCYFAMFSNCSNLIKPPKLAAMNLAEGCYNSMFYKCTHLVSPPQLPATTLAEYCYTSMFENCTSLTTTPILPATKLERWCYSYMFKGCTNLQKVSPILFTDEPYDKNVLAQSTYDITKNCNEMFKDCKNLKYISVRFPIWRTSTTYKYVSTGGRTETSTTPTSENWVSGVASSGTFVCPSNLTKKYGVSYIPSGWTVKSVESLSVYDILIEASSEDYVTITDQWEIEAGTPITFSITDRTDEGYTATVTVQGSDIIETTQSGNDYSFTMPAEDVTISVTYSSTPINYTITTDDYSTVDKTEASEGETVNVTFKDRAGYNLISATYNGTPLIITDNASQFTMPAANVTIATTHTPIEYKITAGEFVTVDKTKATINDQVSFIVEDRANDGYQLDKVLVNNTEVSGTSFNMADYLKDVTITAQYSKIGYTITTDAYSSTNKTTANVGDVVNLTFKDRAGYNLTSATYNGTDLTITNGAAQFTMPAANVTIATTHTPIEYNITVGEFVTVDKTKATINDQVSFTVADRTSDGYKLDKVLVNNTDFTGTSFNMADYLKDVTITAQYSKIGYSITTDAYSSTNKTTANVGDVVNITFKNRAGYNLTSATYNGTALTITNGAAQFTMPAANVTIATTHSPIEYNITPGEFVTVDKTKATINDQVSFTVADRTNDGYKLDKVLVNNTEFTGTSFNMADYLKDVTITAQYSKIGYTITTDAYSSTNKTTANVGDVVNVTFKDRAGYNLTSATYNGTALTITNGAAQFTMPAANVTIATTHTPIEYKITAGEFVTVDKTKATINDQVSFTVEDRTDDGYQLDKVLVNNTEFTGRSFNMADYLKDVTIIAQYSQIAYTITTDDYSSTDKTTANVGDVIDVTFKDRAGYILTSASYNGTALTITNGAAQFTMPAANVTIATTHTPIEYNITPGEFVTVDKTKATINDQVSFTVADRKNDGYKLDKVLVNNTEFTGTSFNMADYLKDVTITAHYSKIGYTITTDAYSSTNKTTANVGDVVNLTFKDRVGYNLISATYNGTALTITNNAAQFTMPAANVTIATNHTPIEYKITADDFVTVDKTKATINDQVSFTVADRTSNGYKLDKVLVNNSEFTETSFNMADYLKDVTITAQYSKIGYTITTDAYSSTNKTTANVGDVVNVTFKNRGGYTLTSATYNGTPLNITNNAAQFTMPAANATIATSYTTIEYNITAGEFITVDKTKATINDKVSFTVADRSSEGLLLEKVLVNNAVFSGFTIDMKNYLQNVEIKAVYAHNSYTITNDEYTTTDKASANEGDVVNVTFTNRVGYNLTSASYNGTELTITNGAAQFTMPAANVTIATTHTHIEYNITPGEFVTVDKTKATINDQVSFTVADRKDDGYKLDKVLVNNTDFSGTSFNMADYLKDVTITAVYSKNSNPVVEYNITNDEFSTTDKSSANEGDVITVTFTNRDGYNLTSATYNGTPLNITNNAAQFTMPAANVTIATTYKPIKNDKLLIVDDIIVEADGYCAGDVLRLSFKTTCKKGKYQIMFSERAKTEGFVDLDFADIEDSERQTAKFDIPSSTNYGNYQGFIRVVDVDGNEGAAFPFGFNIDYPNDIIETKYADLICVNNFSHNYVAYQWMKNGKEIAGANKQFYIDYPALNGVYNVIVTDKNGNKFKVCDFRAAELKTKSAPKPSVNVYPNPAQSMQPVTIELVGVDNTEKCEIMLYTHSGSLVQKISDAKTMNVVNLKSGIYTGVVVINGKKLTFKLIVNE